MATTNPYILLVDDDPDDRQFFHDEFAQQCPEITVIHMPGGNALLQYLDECPEDQLPVAIVLDFQMPDINAPEILRQIAANDRYKQISKVIWSTSSRTQDMQECKRLGAMHYIIKPGTIDEMKNAIRQLTSIVVDLNC